jgi:SARP family transcriptional regulator, regulator of embCAB operon
MLTVHVDQVVPAFSLMRELWEERPPASGICTLQTYILNLRKMLASLTGLSTTQVSNEVLVTRTGGYMLVRGAHEIDLDEYLTLANAGKRALFAGDTDRGVRKLIEALELWRGPVFVDVPLGPLLESTRRKFQESRLVVLELLIDTELRLGMHREVISDLAALVTENPLHEGLQAQYMRALQLSGRRAQAVEVFHQLRSRLIAELGIEPALPLQRLYEAILRSDTNGTREQDPLVTRPLNGIGYGILRSMNAAY